MRDALLLAGRWGIADVCRQGKWKDSMNAFQVVLVALAASESRIVINPEIFTVLEVSSLASWVS